MPLQSVPAAPRLVLSATIAAALACGMIVMSEQAFAASASAADPASAASPAPSDAATAPQLLLRDADGRPVFAGDASAYPSFESATSTALAPCPADADDAARLSVTTSTTSVVVSPSVSVPSGQVVSVPMASSFAEVVPDVQGATADLVLECLALQSGVPSTVTAVAALPVTFADGRWSVPGAPVVVPDPDPSTTTPSEAPPPGGSDPSGSGGSGGASEVASPGTAGTGGPLAFTGFEVAGISALAAGLLGAGAFLVMRRRRNREVVDEA